MAVGSQGAAPDKLAPPDYDALPDAAPVYCGMRWLKARLESILRWWDRGCAAVRGFILLDRGKVAWTTCDAV